MKLWILLSKSYEGRKFFNVGTVAAVIVAGSHIEQRDKPG